MLANQNLGHDLTLIGPSGRVIVIGSRGPVEIDARNIMARNADIRGIMLSPAAAPTLYPPITKALDTGALNPVIAHSFPLKDAPRAHDQITTPGAKGKIVLTM